MKRFVAVLMMAGGFLVAGGANAALIITLTESGGNVVGQATGSLDTSGLRCSSSSEVANLRSTDAFLIVGTITSSPGVDCSGISGPRTFGGSSPNLSPATSAAGDRAGVLGSLGLVFLPTNYQSNTNITPGTATFAGTLSSLQLTPGTYLYTVPGDTITVQIRSAPSATTSAATSITTTGATLNGTVNDNGASTTVTFNYGTTVGYGSSATAAQSPIASGAGSTSVSAAITGLACNTTYHYQVSATNSVGTTNGSDATFTTSVCPAPTVSSVSPTSGTTAGGTAIAITGTGFLSGATATVGGITCSSLTVVSSTSITCTTGAHAAGAVNVAVTNTDTQTGTGTNVYTYQSSNESGTTPGGNVSAAVSGGTFVAGTAQFTTPISPPSGQSFPYGVFGFTASTTSGGTITVTLTYPQALAAGTKVWKDLNGTWLDWTNNVTISGNTITYTITDGGAGDSDGAVNGSITDPLGPATTSIAVPTLSEWSQMLLGLMVLSMIGWHFHKQRSY